MRLYLKQIPIDEFEYITVGIDHKSYERPDSPTLQDRGYHHQPSATGKVAIGQGYSTIAWIPEEEGSWALPIRHERITSLDWRRNASLRINLEKVSKAFHRRSLISIGQTKTTLDITFLKYATSMGKME